MGFIGMLGSAASAATRIGNSYKKTEDELRREQEEREQRKIQEARERQRQLLQEAALRKDAEGFNPETDTVVQRTRYMQQEGLTERPGSQPRPPVRGTDEYKRMIEEEEKARARARANAPPEPPSPSERRAEERERREEEERQRERAVAQIRAHIRATMARRRAANPDATNVFGGHGTNAGADYREIQRRWPGVLNNDEIFEIAGSVYRDLNP